MHPAEIGMILILVVAILVIGGSFIAPYWNGLQNQAALVSATQTLIAQSAANQSAILAADREQSNVKIAQAQAVQTASFASANASQTESAARAFVAPTIAAQNAQATSIAQVVQVQAYATERAVNTEATRIWNMTQAQATATIYAVNADATRAYNSAQAQAMVTSTMQAGQYKMAQLQGEQQSIARATDTAKQIMLTELQNQAAHDKREQDAEALKWPLLIGGLSTVGLASIWLYAWKHSRAVPNTGAAFNRALEQGTPIIIQDAGRLIGFNVVEKAPADSANNRPTVLVMHVPELQSGNQRINSLAQAQECRTCAPRRED